uniref:Uncharacterized protein n=1 Tax=Anguilla anguilla TaxID=7936 RepID=A0A0E9XJV4_ANGAN
MFIKGKNSKWFNRERKSFSYIDFQIMENMLPKNYTFLEVHHMAFQRKIYTILWLS